ncbi:MAG TPA: helix-turn-helix domain-containing protein [Methanomassiliicoccales archaeon]|jgi:predicted DNA binding protein
MKFLDTSLRMHHDRTFCNFAGRYPEARMALWCLNANEMLYVSAKSPEQAERIVEEAQTALEVDHSFLDGASAVLTMSICSCNDPNSIDNVAHRCRCWLIPPVVFVGGWAHYRIFSPSRPDLRRFIDICSKDSEVEVISHHGRENLDLILDSGIVPVHLFDGISDRQLGVLATAFDSGLLDVPAKVEMDEVAKREGISRSTYGEHLRKSLHQMVKNSYPLLRSYQERSLQPRR